MIGNELDMNYIIGVANVLVIVVLIPTLTNRKSFIPRTTSIPTSAALLMFTFVFFNEGLLIGASMEALSSFLWLFISIVKGKEVFMTKEVPG